MPSFLRHLQPVSLRVGEGEAARWYPSLVLDFEEGKEVVVGVPLEGGYETRVEPGSVVGVQTTHPDGIRVFAATVLRRDTAPSPALRLSWPADVQRVQRREAVRVEVMVRAEVRVLADEGAPRALDGSTADLSEGGARLLLGEPLAPGTALEIVLHLPSAGAVECAGRVVRSGEADRAAPERRHWAAVEFTRLPAAARRELTRFVFDVQRERLRKGVA
ncbi:MAG TPA: PilZ domain-containing protein [Longimicrobiaceae bacterium]